MSKKVMIAACAILVTPTVTAVASSHDEADRCQEVRGRAVLVEVQDPCRENTEFAVCFVQKVRGTLRGKWVAFQQEGWGDTDLGAAGLPVPPGSPASFYIREFEVFETKKGTVYGDAQTVFDVRIFESDGGGALPTIITGGTGIYEDATGWIVPVFTDGTVEILKILGRICGPNIPSDGDDDDSDGDSDDD